MIDFDAHPQERVALFVALFCKSFKAKGLGRYYTKTNRHKVKLKYYAYKISLPRQGSVKITKRSRNSTKSTMKQLNRTFLLLSNSQHIKLVTKTVRWWDKVFGYKTVMDDIAASYADNMHLDTYVRIAKEIELRTNQQYIQRIWNRALSDTTILTKLHKEAKDRLTQELLENCQIIQLRNLKAVSYTHLTLPTKA